MSALLQAQLPGLVAIARLPGSLNVASSVPLLERFQRPVDTDRPPGRRLEGFYLDQPKPRDDPYRCFRWWRTV
jgi:hypothetical protein